MFSLHFFHSIFVLKYTHSVCYYLAQAHPMMLKKHLIVPDKSFVIGAISEQVFINFCCKIETFANTCL